MSTPTAINHGEARQIEVVMSDTLLRENAALKDRIRELESRLTSADKVAETYRKLAGEAEEGEGMTDDDILTLWPQHEGRIPATEVLRFARMIESRARAEEREAILAWIGSEELPFEDSDTTELIYRIMDAIRARGEA